MLRSFLSPRRGLALAGLLALAAVLPPAVGAQPAPPPPPPSPTGKSLAILATDVYPRADTEVDLGNSQRVRPLKPSRPHPARTPWQTGSSSAFATAHRIRIARIRISRRPAE